MFRYGTNCVLTVSQITYYGSVATSTDSKAVTRKTRARNTSVATKITMAISGLFFVFFVVFHAYGNLKMFMGPYAFDGYAHWLRDPFPHLIPPMWFLWAFRALLALSLIIHVEAAVRLWWKARKARGTSAYVNHQTLATSYASRTMRWGGIIILVFIVFHILHFTTLTFEIGGDYHALSPYERMVVSFQNWYMVLAYLIPVTALAMHVRHGVWSALATLGANKKRRERMINLVAIAIGAVVFLAFMLPPFGIFFGIIS